MIMAEDTPNPAVLCAERQLLLLGEMAEIGMIMLRDLKGQADPAEAFVRLSRAVRLTFALETKAHQELRALNAEIVHIREVDEEKAAEAARVVKETTASKRKSQVKRLVLAVAESESESLEDYIETWDRLEEKLDRNLGLYRDIGDWQTRYAVERLCEDLGLEPNWDCWTGEGWNERYQRPRLGGRFQPVVSSSLNLPLNGAFAHSDSRPQLE